MAVDNYQVSLDTVFSTFGELRNFASLLKSPDCALSIFDANSLLQGYVNKMESSLFEFEQLIEQQYRQKQG